MAIKEMEMKKALKGGYLTTDNEHVVENGNYGIDYKVLISNGTAFYSVFYVNASNEGEALDEVMDFCVNNDFTGLYYIGEEIIANDELVDDYISCGNQCNYFHYLSKVETL